MGTDIYGGAMKRFAGLFLIMAICCGAAGCSVQDEYGPSLGAPPAQSENMREESSSVKSESDEEAETLDIYFFHNTPCASCNGEEEFYEIYREALQDVDREKYPNEVLSYNTFQTGGQEKLEEIASAWGIPLDDIQEPSVLINGRVFNGLEAIGKNLKEQYLLAWEDGDPTVNAAAVQKENRLTEEQLFDDWEAEKDHLTVVYFYRTTCGECIETKPFLDEIPETIDINGQPVKIDLIQLNTREGKNGQRISMFFQTYQVPEEDQMVPIVFFTDSYLAGIKQIGPGLAEKLEQGAGMGFDWPGSSTG